MRRTAIIAVVLVLIAAGVAVGLVFFWPFGSSGRELRLPGVVEIQDVRLGPRVGGRVTKVHTAEGLVVKPNDVLVELEAPELDAELSQWQGQLHQAQVQLAKVQNGPRYQELAASAATEDAARARLIRMRVGSRPEEIDQARANVESARSQVANAGQRYERNVNLYKTNAVTKQELDDSKTALDRGRDDQAAAEARLIMAEAGNRIEDMEESAAMYRQAKASHQLLVEQTPLDVQDAEAKVEQAKGKVDEIQANLQELIVKAPEDAVVEVLSVRPGDLVAPNQPVVRVLRTADLWIKVYVPETELGKIHVGQAVTATVDSYPNKPLQGKIVEINSESEFTPRNVQSLDERRHQVFGVRVRVDKPEGIIKSGMAADVVISLEP